MVLLPELNKQPGLVAMAQVEQDESLEKATRQNDGSYALPPMKPRHTDDDEDDESVTKNQNDAYDHDDRNARFGGPGKGNPNLRKPGSWPSSTPERSGKATSHRPGSAPHRRQAASHHRNRNNLVNDANKRATNFKGKQTNSYGRKTNNFSNGKIQQYEVARDITDDSIATRLSFEKNDVHDSGIKADRKSNAHFLRNDKNKTSKKVRSKVGHSYVLKSEVGPGGRNRLFADDGGNSGNEFVDLRLKLLNDYITLHEPVFKKSKKPRTNSRRVSTDTGDRASDDKARDRYKERVDEELTKSKQKKSPYRTISKLAKKPYGIQGYNRSKENKSKVDPQKLREGLTTPATTCKVYSSRPAAKPDPLLFKERSEMWKLRNHTDEEHVLTENEADMYIQIRNVYKDRSLSDKERRKLEFLKKVESLQTECAKEMNNQLRLKEIKEENKRHMQNEQLYFIRKRFLEEQVKRWRTQYVTVKVLQHEKNDRFLYGLPELFDEIPHYKTRARKRRKAVGADSKKNAQRYGQMFEHNPGPVVFRAKTPKMENYVIVEEKDDKGNTIEKRIRMKDIVNDAKKVLTIPTIKDIEEEDAESTLSKSTRASLRSLDLDDQEDIFEKARRKYGIDVESESDDDDY